MRRRQRRASHSEASTVFLLWLLLASSLPAQALGPGTGRMLEHALQQAEEFRKQLPALQYNATIRVQEWNGRGRLRGTANASMIVRPGDTLHPITYLSREVHGKVKLPDANEHSKEDVNDKTTLQDFARDHRIAERFDFKVGGGGEVSGEDTRRVDFSPKPNQPEKNTADRFLDSITGSAWLTERKNGLVKFEMQLLHPFQLLWIFAVLKEFSIQYELIEPGDFLGHARIKVRFALTTPIYSIRQQHDVEIDHFRRREAFAVVRAARDYDRARED